MKALTKLTVLGSLVLSACGGGGGGGSGSGGTGQITNTVPVVTPSTTLLKGVAASGGPVANAPISVTMTPSLGASLGAPTACPSAGTPLTDAQGNFSVDISACMGSGGFIVLSTTDANGHLLMTAYGPPMINATTGAAYVNLTPLTTLVLAAAGGTTVSSALASLNNGVYGFQSSAVSPSLAQLEVWMQLVGLQATPKMALAEAATSVMSWNTWNGDDLFTTAFNADHSGIDAVLDSVMLSGTPPQQLTDLGGNLLEQPVGTSLATGNYALVTWPTAVSQALSQAYLYPTSILIPTPRTYTGTMASTTGSGTCSLTVSLSLTATPGTVSGTCTSPATGTVSLNGTVASNGQSGFANGAGVSFTGGITAMGGSGNWSKGTLTGTWAIH